MTLSVDQSATGIEWYLDGELLAEDQAQLEVQEAGTYYAILSNQDCSLQTESVEIQVIPSPSLEIALSGEASICEGESVTLSADPSATGIAWYLDGELLGENGAEIEAQEDGTYYAILSNLACNIQTESVEVQVIPYPNPEIAISGETSFCEGESATLSVDPSATAVEWYLDGVLLAGEEPNIEVQDAGTYYAILSNQDCSIQTISVEIQVIPSPSEEIALGGESSICEGESVTLSADPSATGIEWYLDGVLLAGEGPQLEVQAEGTYYAILSNEVCTIQSESVEVQVIPYPNPGITLTGETSICEGESVLLNVDTAANAIAWYLNGELLGSEEPQIEVQEEAVYYAILSNQDCSVQTESVEIQVIPSQPRDRPVG
ncbi:MAG: PKD domain-containing protein [Saprospirales bacterium]|nr:PKD domain-containing protein [Saprospirales bacterium]